MSQFKNAVCGSVCLFTLLWGRDSMYLQMGCWSWHCTILSGDILPSLHKYYQIINTERPLNTWKYKNNTSSGHTGSTSEITGEPESELKPKRLCSAIWVMDSGNGAVWWATMREIFTVAVIRVRSLECRGMDREEFPVFHVGVLYGAQQVLLSRSIPSHEGQQMVAAQHVESQVALYLSVMLPPQKDEPLSSLFSFFFSCLHLFPLSCSIASSYKLNMFLLFTFVFWSPWLFSHCILLRPLSCWFVVPVWGHTKIWL